MFEKLELTRMAQTMAAQAGARMGVIAQNVANADTPGFKAMDMPSFGETYQDAGGQMRATRPGHSDGASAGTMPLARRDKGVGAPNGNTVSLETEMVKAAGARQDHEMALAIYRNTSDIIRASLGRSR
jgi:flagellar basal-body rod protein FlgB